MKYFSLKAQSAEKFILHLHLIFPREIAPFLPFRAINLPLPPPRNGEKLPSFLFTSATLQTNDSVTGWADQKCEINLCTGERNKM